MKKTLFFALAFVIIMSLALSLGACEFIDTHTHDFTVQSTDEDFLKSDADCTNSAIYYYSCECGKIGTESFEYGDPLGHSWDDATCEAPKTCIECGATEGEKLDHDYVDGICDNCGEEDPDYEEPHTHNYTRVVTDPTCTMRGYTTYTCSCGDEYTDNYVDAIGHDWSDATCEAPKTCKVCKITAGGKIKHDYVDGVCSMCGKKDPAGSAHTHSYSATITLPTCTTEGYTTYECSCGDEYTDNYVDAIGHDWSDATCEVPKTCMVCKVTEGGKIKHDYVDGICSMCGKEDPDYEEPHTHNYTRVVTDPTCTTRGYTTYTCSCGDEYTDDYVDAIGHDWSDATCEAPKTCKVCKVTEGGKLKHDYIDGVCAMCGKEDPAGSAHTHSYNATITLPTCTTDGYTTYTCSCGDEYTDDYVDALGHDEVIDEAVAPTCTETGLTEGMHCDREECGAVLIVQEEISAYGHNYETIYIYPTCDEDGYIIEVCSLCGNEGDIIEVPAYGHSLSSYEIQPTCTEDGWYIWVCDFCGMEERELLPSTGHEYDYNGQCVHCKLYNPEICEHAYNRYDCTIDTLCYLCEGSTLPASEHSWKAATCTLPITCENCTMTQGEPLDHDWKEATCTLPETCSRCPETRGEALDHDWKDATCTESKFCARCLIKDGEPLGHDWKDPTCTLPETCSRCPETRGEALDHDWKDATCTTPKSCTRCPAIDGEALDHDWKDATCTLPETCSRCPEERGEPLDHDCDGVTCVVCGNVIGSIGLEYTLSTDGTYYTVNGIGECTDKSIVIPYAFNNIPVKKIGTNAFRDIVSVTIPNSVTSINFDAFYNCHKLVEIINHSSLNITIGSSDFGYVAYYAKEIHAGESKIVNYNDYLFYTYNNVNYLLGYVGEDTELILPEAYKGEKYSIYKYAFYNCSSLTNITVPSSVTSIGDNAFYGCSNLTSITIPNSVTSIGKNAFYDCSSLESITLPFVGNTKDGTENTHFGYIFGAYTYEDNTEHVPESLKTVVITGGSSIDDDAFRGCSSLTSINIPNSVTNIGDYAFYNCSSLTNITVPSSVTSIGERAFSGCSSLESITLPFVGATKVGTENTHFGYIFGAKTYRYNTGHVPASLKTVVITGGDIIDDYVFYGCSKITSVEIPNGITTIGNNAFYGCSSLASITIPDSVTKIGESAFKNCTSLAEAIIGNSVITIGNSAFKGCSALTGIIIPDGVTAIPAYAFNGCSSLASVTIPDGVTSISNYAFYYCSELTSITIPDSVTSIDEWAFANCYKLANVIFENNSKLTSINNYSFAYCYNLSGIALPDSLTKIGDYAFYDCSRFTSITIPANVTSIGDCAFEECHTLVEVINHASQLDDITKDYTSYGHVAYYAKEVHTGESKIVNHNNYLFYTYDNINYLLGYVGEDTELVLPENYNGEEYVIYKYAFYNCKKLTSVVIPDSVAIIDLSAFGGCSNLESITIPFVGKTINGNHFGYIFGAKSYSDNSKCVPSSLKTVIITGGTSISDHAFYSCTNIESILLPYSVTSIDDYAFNSCYSLASITIPDSVTSIGNGAFSVCTSLESITIPHGITSIGYSTFNACSSLTSITIPNSVISIGDRAFEDCHNLTSITIPSSVTSIGVNAFYVFAYYSSSLKDVYITDMTAWCSISFGNTCSNPLYYADNLYLNEVLVTELVIPDDVTDIKDFAFYGCKSIEHITIPDSITSIGSSAFYGCSNLESITLPFVGATIDGSSNTHFGYIFGADTYSSNNSCIPSSLKTVIITDSNSIAEYAFYGCENLINVTIPDSVYNRIGSSAFSGCANLESLTIPYAGGYDINRYPFGYIFGTSSYTGGVATTQSYYDEQTCISTRQTYYIPATLKSVTISTALSPYAFTNCSTLTNVVIADSITNIPMRAFYNCSNLTSINIGKVRTIDERAFYCCSGLYSIVVSSVISIGDSAFAGCAHLVEIIAHPSHFTAGSFDHGYVAYYAKEVHTGESKIVNYNDYLFYTYDNVNYLVGYVGKDVILILPDSYNGEKYVINKYAFIGNKNIISVTISDNVEKIDDGAFSGCNKLVEVINHSSSLNIVVGSNNHGCVASYAKEVHTGKSKIVNSDGYLFYTYNDIKYLMGYIGDSAFVCLPHSYYYRNYMIYDYAFYNCYTITGLQISSETAIGIGDYAFYGCCRLAHASIDGITSIGTSAFEGCSILKSITIPDSATIIGDWAFSNCSNLTSIIIPNSVTSIGFEAFINCSNLTSVTFKNPNGWWNTSNSAATSGYNISASNLTNSSEAAEYLKKNCSYYWRRT